MYAGKEKGRLRSIELDDDLVASGADVNAKNALAFSTVAMVRGGTWKK